MHSFSWIFATGCRRRGQLAILVGAVLGAGCGSPDPGKGVHDRVQPEYDRSGRLTKLSYDRNGDGKPETWGYMDGARVIRVEADKDADGRVDHWEFYRVPPPGSTAAPGSKELLERIERAKTGTGHVTRTEFFEGGAMARVEEDTDGDGRIDKWETYTDGALSTMALDTTGRGTPDRRLVYSATGALDRIEADPTGSGRFEAVNP